MFPFADTTPPPQALFNEMDNYDPVELKKKHYRSVMLRLQKTELSVVRLKKQYPRGAMWNELIPKRAPPDVLLTAYDVNGAQIYLLPADLKKHSTWSKKSPICIRVSERGATEQQDSGETLVLLARSSRDKETWFRLLVAAAAGRPLKRGQKCLIARNPTALDKHQTNSYLDYMSQVMPVSGLKLPATLGPSSLFSDGAEPHLVWMNALIKRCFWDFLEHEHKLALFQEKLQKKVSRLKVCFNTHLQVLFE